MTELMWVLAGLGSTIGLAAAVVVLCWAWPQVRRQTCRERLWECNAFMWPSCSDGRCKYHCSLYCKCVPRPESAGELRVFRGGRK